MAGGRGGQGAAVALWAAFALAAVASGWIAVQMVGSAVSPGALPVLSGEEVARTLETAAPRPGDPSPAPSREPRTSGEPDREVGAEPTSDAVVRTVSSPGGSAVAACDGETLTLRSVSPAVGFRVAEIEQESTATEIRFVSQAAEVKMEVGCVAGVPQAAAEIDEESGDDD